jgi:uncharacterized membrane protein
LKTSCELASKDWTPASRRLLQSAMEKSRIAALVDGIFAVAMTLLVLDLRLPEGVKISNDAGMAAIG